MTMRITTLLSSLLIAFAAGACSSATAPGTPSYYEDVQPIIQGSCAHCHGQTAPVTGLGYRFDICSPAAFAETGFVFEKNTGVMNNVLAGLIAGDVTPDGDRAKMPPPPSGELSTYERDVLVNWAKKPSCPPRPNNHKPVVKLVGKLSYTDAGLTLTVDVTDADEETVLGTVTAGAALPAFISHTGRNKLTIEGVTADDQPVHVKVSDGTVLVEKDL
jgi:hypothetical protein